MSSIINYIIAFLIGYGFSILHDKVEEGKITAISTELAVGLSMIGIIVITLMVTI